MGGMELEERRGGGRREESCRWITKQREARHEKRTGAGVAAWIWQQKLTPGFTRFSRLIKSTPTSNPLTRHALERLQLVHLRSPACPSAGRSQGTLFDGLSKSAHNEIILPNKRGLLACWTSKARLTATV